MLRGPTSFPGSLVGPLDVMPAVVGPSLRRRPRMAKLWMAKLGHWGREEPVTISPRSARQAGHAIRLWIVHRRKPVQVADPEGCLPSEAERTDRRNEMNSLRKRCTWRWSGCVQVMCTSLPQDTRGENLAIRSMSRLNGKEAGTWLEGERGRDPNRLLPPPPLATSPGGRGAGHFGLFAVFFEESGCT